MGPAKHSASALLEAAVLYYMSTARMQLKQYARQWHVTSGNMVSAPLAPHH